MNDGTPPQLGKGGGTPLSQTTGNSDALSIDSNTVNGGVFRVTPQMNSNKLTSEGYETPPDAVSALNNIIHPLLNDQDNKLDEKLQTRILEEELGETFKVAFFRRYSLVFQVSSLFMHQSIPAVLIPLPGNSGAFSRTFHPGGRALAFHPITPGHLTIPHSFTLQHCRFF